MECSLHIFETQESNTAKESQVNKLSSTDQVVLPHGNQEGPLGLCPLGRTSTKVSNIFSFLPSMDTRSPCNTVTWRAQARRQRGNSLLHVDKE